MISSISSNHEKTRWIRLKNQSFLPWWFPSSSKHQISRIFPMVVLNRSRNPSPGWMVPMSHALGLRGFNARINCTWQVQPKYGTSHPDCGEKDGKKNIQQSLPSLLCRSCGNEKKYWKKYPVKKSTLVWICAGHHNLLWIQHHQRRTNDLPFKFFEVTRKLTHN